MKIKEGVFLREISGIFMIDTGRKSDRKYKLTLNETGAFVWKCIEKNYDKDKIVAEILNEYNVEESRAYKCVSDFIDKLIKADLIYG